MPALPPALFAASGGKTEKGSPERIISPGYEKDVQEAAHIVGGPEPSGQELAKRGAELAVWVFLPGELLWHFRCANYCSQSTLLRHPAGDSRAAAT